MSRSRHLVDDPVVGLVRDWIAVNRDVIAAHAQPGAGPAQTKAAAEVGDLTNRLGALSELVTTGELEPEDYAVATQSIRTRLVDAKRRAVVSAGKPSLARLLAFEDPAIEFDRLVVEDVEALRAALREILDAVVVIPGKRGPDGLEVQWSEWAASVDGR